jgi:inosine/xanthosine triphosphate pyrophosphatase family protein
MRGNDEKVILDLNYPEFQSQLLDLEPTELRKVFKSLKKIRALTWQAVFQDKGLHWEELKSRPGKYTVRLSQGYRAVVIRDGTAMRFQALHPDHDSAYGKK